MNRMGETRFPGVLALAVFVWLVAFSASVARAANPLPSWHDGATKQRIVDFVQGVTARGSPAFVAPEDRIVDDKAGKPVGIHKFIGRRPIAAFGNSDGDFEMLEYVKAGPGPRLAVLVRHDDAQREFAYDRDSAVGRLARGLDEAAARGWVVVSMKNDWRVVHALPGR